MSDVQKPYISDEEWIACGIDIWMIRENLKLTFEQRIEQHQQLVNTTNELIQIGHEHRKQSNPTSQRAHS